MKRVSNGRDLLKQKWIEAKQGHVFQFLDQGLLSKKEEEEFWNQLESIDVVAANNCFLEMLKQGTDAENKIEPIRTVKLSTASTEQKEKWLNLGYNALAEGQVAVLLMAGGQGTRLSSIDPKGMYDVGLPSGKTLFQIQAERILKIQELAAERSGKGQVILPWYVMTSSIVDKRTREFFEENNYFGLSKENVHFFQQGDFPCFTPEGKIILQSKSEVAMAPNGNGDVWQALKRHRIFDELEKKGIKWLWSYCVDNILVKIADPIFLGFCIENDLEIASKVVPKANPTERVGVLALRNDRYTVLEYSEIDEEKRLAVSPVTGDLMYNASHLVINIFSVDFVKHNVDNHLPYHVAKKAIPQADENGVPVAPKEINGWKLELFSFDIFSFAKKMLAFETVRSEEFSPLKNSMSLPTDNAETCCNHLCQLHMKWIEDAGGVILNKENKLCEISPLISYSGEGLEKYVAGKEITLPYHLEREK